MMDQEKRAGNESGYQPTHDHSGSYVQIVSQPDTDSLRAELTKAKTDSARLLSAISGPKAGVVQNVEATHKALVSLALEFRGKAAQRDCPKLAQEDIRNCQEALSAAKKLEPHIQATVRTLVATICGQDKKALVEAMAA